MYSLLSLSTCLLFCALCVWLWMLLSILYFISFFSFLAFPPQPMRITHSIADNSPQNNRLPALQHISAYPSPYVWDVRRPRGRNFTGERPSFFHTSAISCGRPGSLNCVIKGLYHFCKSRVFPLLVRRRDIKCNIRVYLASMLAANRPISNPFQSTAEREAEDNYAHWEMLLYIFFFFLFLTRTQGTQIIPNLLFLRWMILIRSDLAKTAVWSLK